MSDSSRTRLIDAGEVGAGYPNAYPQPGVASFAPPYPEGAAGPMLPPPGTHIDPRLWSHTALAGALGIQAAIEHPHVRALLMDAIDKAMRNSFKPVALQPWVEKPFRGQYFGGLVRHDVALMAAAGTWVTIDDVAGSKTAQYVIPDGHMGVIKEFAQVVTNANEWPFINWRVTVNDIPVAPLMDFCGQIGTMENKQELTILVYPGSTVKVEVEVIAGAPAAGIKDMGAWLLGWFWPMENDSAIDNAQGHATVA